MKMLNKLICHFKGHVSLQRDQHYDRIYYLLENSGAYCRGITVISGGRLYQCSRCGELHIIRGVLSWELEDLIDATLEDFAPIAVNWATSLDYSVCRIYESGRDRWCKECRAKIEIAKDMDVIPICKSCAERN